MSDLKTIKDIFARAGVVFSESRDETGACLTMPQGAGPSNDGYRGFMAQLVFNPDESLKSIGAWE